MTNRLASLPEARFRLLPALLDSISFDETELRKLAILSSLVAIPLLFAAAFVFSSDGPMAVFGWGASYCASVFFVFSMGANLPRAWPGLMANEKAPLPMLSFTAILAAESIMASLVSLGILAITLLFTPVFPFVVAKKNMRMRVLNIIEKTGDKWLVLFTPARKTLLIMRRRLCLDRIRISQLYSQVLAERIMRDAKAKAWLSPSEPENANLSALLSKACKSSPLQFVWPASWRDDKHSCASAEIIRGIQGDFSWHPDDAIPSLVEILEAERKTIPAGSGLAISIDAMLAEREGAAISKSLGGHDLSVTAKASSI